MGPFSTREFPTLAKRIFIAAILFTEGYKGASQPQSDFEAVRAEILAIENKWASAIEQEDAAAFDGRTCTCGEMGDGKQSAAS